MYDGWTENAMLPPRTEREADEAGKAHDVQRHGETQVSIYENDQRAMLLWYHDHAMGITRFNVHAGLAGAYLIRDPDEEKRLLAQGISLPCGQYDVPLIIQDRNLDATDDGRLNGVLLHKSTSGTAEFFGPYTLVNGVIWPKMSVERRRYRLRLLNGSNARTYCLKVVCHDAGGNPTEIPLNSFVRQIGTDGGLLAKPVLLPDGSPVPSPDGKPVPTTDGLILASAEQSADLYVGLRQIGNEIKSLKVLVNTAFAPFHQFTIQHPDPNQAETDPTTKKPVPAASAGNTVPGMRLPYASVMRFDLGAAPARDPATDLIVPPPGTNLTLADDLGPETHADLPGAPDPHGHRLVALVENPPGMLMMYELAEATPEQLGRFTPQTVSALIAIQDKDDKGNPVVKTYAPVATRFDDQVAFFPPYGRWEMWKILNLTVDTHPFHVHLVQFRILERRLFDTGGFNSMTGGTAPNQPVALRGAGRLDDNEKGWKDTVRVNPGDMVSIAMRFDGFTGRYMYHCHILEHEDHDMMRPFVVTPRPVMDLMPDMPMLDGMGGMAGMSEMNKKGKTTPKKT